MRILLILALLAVASETTAQVTFLDGTFSDVDWTTTVFVLNHPSTGGTSVQESSGGNPGEHRAITSLTCSGGGNPCRVMVIGIKPTAQFDPSSQGPILSLSYGEDQKCASTDGCLGGGQIWLPTLLQAGKYYVHNAGPTSVLNSWTSKALSGLLATDFGEVVLAGIGYQDLGSNPDFSIGGAPIQFGYARANSLSNQRTGRIDNWTFSVMQPTVAVATSPWGEVKRLYK